MGVKYERSLIIFISFCIVLNLQKGDQTNPIFIAQRRQDLQTFFDQIFSSEIKKLECVEEFCLRAKKEFDVIVKENERINNAKNSNRVLILEDNKFRMEESKQDLKGKENKNKTKKRNINNID